ncbi:hypothetical protein B0J12DRAFT_653134 [Macrophomina phaseolina]|uniref:Secreted protein n=1 Tax=Macrophomina phaseolina TaxID=35725 RepID=A0ABQ8GL24_9PEZI|nr:hypothetical protein B0J12DRAFT_653134 [Macrophomina phaseolina]
MGTAASLIPTQAALASTNPCQQKRLALSLVLSLFPAQMLGIQSQAFRASLRRLPEHSQSSTMTVYTAQEREKRDNRTILPHQLHAGDIARSLFRTSSHSPSFSAARRK